MGLFGKMEPAPAAKRNTGELLALSGVVGLLLSKLSEEHPDLNAMVSAMYIAGMSEGRAAGLPEETLESFQAAMKRYAAAARTSI